MMMTLGLFVFKLRTLPYQTLKRDVGYGWVENKRVGQRPITQYLGLGTETITLTGQLLPEVTGGQTYLQVFESMADSGRAWPLIEGSGTIYGMFVVQSFNHTNSQLNTDGRARNISFELTLKRVDESYAAMFGDLQEQAKGLYNKASSTVKQLFPNGVSL
ncbi:phage tail protein [Ewingella americana]|uniref:phage tail protein n=1 Tax=Ewingella americana TaxID=41202 RepID=UPI0012AD24C2|nr:phage tail protein [Ewingella americana]MRT03767.1 phage tail protein [Ewingella americana]